MICVVGTARATPEADLGLHIHGWRLRSFMMTGRFTGWAIGRPRPFAGGPAGREAADQNSTITCGMMRSSSPLLPRLRMAATAAAW